MIEVEVKLRIQDKRVIEKILLENGFQKSSHIKERDAYFDNAAGEIRSGGLALRIRETVDLTSGNAFAQMNFKGKKMDQISMSRPEYETTIGDAKAGEAILESLGYSKVNPEVIKIRTQLSKGLMNACIDEVEGLGTYLELEIVVNFESEKEDALNEIEKMLHVLGCEIGDTTTTSYLTMLQK